MSAVSTRRSNAGQHGAIRSLWADALRRLLAHRAAVWSLGTLAFVLAASVLGPFLTGHEHDRVYQDYVRTPASLAAHPSPDHVRAALDKLAGRMWARLENVSIGTRMISFTIVADRALDLRVLNAFGRSDLFEQARLVARSGDGKRLDVEAALERHRFLFGTDQNGRDLLTRTLMAGRISLAIGLVASVVALLIGVTWGAVAGYSGGRVDMAMMRVVDVLYALPFIFFVILLVVIFGRNLILMFAAVGAVEWLDMARIVRGQTLALKQQEFVVAAEALGVDTAGIIRRHIIPNLLGPVIVYMTLTVPKVILLESFLSFLGLGVQEPLTSWGALISEGARNIEGAPGMLVFPATFLVATLLALNFLGDGLRDALDPKER